MKFSERQLEIIEAAGKILTEAGVGGLTTKKLAKEMGFSEAAIYRHFSGKEEILIALLEFLCKNMDQRLEMAIQEGGDSESKFRSVFANQFQFFSKHPHFVVAVFSEGLLEESQRINQVISQLMQVKMKYLKLAISSGQESGVFSKEISLEDMIHHVMGSFRLLMFKWRISNFQFDLQERGESIVDSLLVLMKR
ncbi:transcriptional regulator, TetR family [Algoriphagus faecimaris]|uniref:Transcriptional regulator, TetR family n=1 Tax=Algoriphagus faecimaris TaxID=686796 RepID=A0A1G6VNS1_9BACT|nr:TetR/AcrR family transcriptional regulator [Algoriphagus faecimaris]SDD54476.1 transcriptional regulator, TetR family [Algoriphagus faecimaris]